MVLVESPLWVERDLTRSLSIKKTLLNVGVKTCSVSSSSSAPRTFFRWMFIADIKVDLSCCRLFFLADSQTVYGGGVLLCAAENKLHGVKLVMSAVIHVYVLEPGPSNEDRKGPTTSLI